MSVNFCLSHEQVSVTIEKREAVCILMQYEIKLTYIFAKWAFKFICIMYSFTEWLLCGNLVLVGISLQQIHFNVKDSLEQAWSL